MRPEEYGPIAQDGDPFAVFAALQARNAELVARDAAMQHAMLGAGKRVWEQAQAEHEQLIGLTDELILDSLRAR